MSTIEALMLLAGFGVVGLAVCDLIICPILALLANLTVWCLSRIGDLVRYLFKMSDE